MRWINSAIRHGTPPADVDLVGSLLTIGEATVTDQTTPLLTGNQQLQSPLIRHQPLEGPQTDTVMASGEIEQPRGHR